MGASVGHLPMDSQVLRACKYLVREVHGRGLGTGDRLPPQTDLRQATAYSNDTLSGAMQVLAEAGMLVRRVGQGTTIALPDRQPDGLWTIGLLVQRGIIARIPFYALLVSLLQEALADAGLRSQIHLQRTDQPDPEGGVGFDDFHLLRHDLDEGRLDAILTFSGLGRDECALLRARGIPVVHVGPWEGAPGGAIIDRYEWVRQATARFIADGHRRFGVVSMAGHRGGVEPFWQGHLAALAAAGLSPDCTVSYSAGEGIPAGQEVARRLLAEPTPPDALIVVDDRVAVGLTDGLASGSRYRPPIAVQTNRQAPFMFALPIIPYEVDVEDLVRQGVEILRYSLVHPHEPTEIRRLPPTAHDRQPRKLP